LDIDLAEIPRNQTGYHCGKRCDDHAHYQLINVLFDYYFHFLFERKLALDHLSFLNA
jgi:hypothetical protein